MKGLTYDADADHVPTFNFLLWFTYIFSKLLIMKIIITIILTPKHLVVCQCTGSVDGSAGGW